MKRKTLLTCLGSIALAMCLTQTAFGDVYRWTGLAGDGMWNNGNNWTNETQMTSGQVPVGANTNDVIINPINGSTSCTITNTDDILGPNMLFGPEWGFTFNIYGTLRCFWYMVPVQWDSAGTRSVINMYSNSVYTAEGIALGDTWWWSGGPYVTMNMYDNSFVGINWMFWGGRLNLYDHAVYSITNGLTVAIAGAVSDATRSINLEGNAKLVLPATFGATVTNWISRGILLTYSTPGQYAYLVVNEADAEWPSRTVVTTTATGPQTLTAIRIQVPRTALYVGGVEQAQVFGDYPTSTNVNVSSFPNLTYASTDTNVVTINGTGMVRAVGVGSATLWAYLDTLSNSVAITVTTYTNNTTTLVHRYSFNETSGTTVADSIGGSSWDGTLVAGAFLTGSQVDLNGVDGYVNLPAGIVNSNMDAVSIEAWASFSPSLTNWSALFAFGDIDVNTGLGHHYIAMQPHASGSTVARTSISDANPGYAHEANCGVGPVLNGRTNLHIVAVFHPQVGYSSLYTNGVLAAINSDVTILMADALSSGVPYGFLGRSLYSGFALATPDPYLPGSIDEFRVYSGALTPGQIQAGNLLGQNQLIGTGTTVSLSAKLVGTDVAVTWSTNSALVDLASSPTLGPGAVWTPVTTGTFALEGGNYVRTTPASADARYFRLQK